MSEGTPPPLPPTPAVPPVIRQQPPPIPTQPPAGRPGVVLAFRWWCVLFVLIYLCMTTLEILVACNVVEPDLDLIEMAVSHHDPKARAEIIAEKRADAPGFATFCALIAFTYAFAATLPRKPWAWTFGLVIVCTTILPFILTAAGAIPLLVNWIKPAVKLYFNRRP